MVVFKNAVSDKNSYRRYRIKKVSGIDDYACIAEITQRRYVRLYFEKRKMPDLDPCRLMSIERNFDEH